MRVVVFGTYRSGSSMVAGMLDRLGVHLGAPYWGEHFESAKLAEMLRDWWSEPELRETVNAATRIDELKRWIEALEVSQSQSAGRSITVQRDDNTLIVGAKHPLLCLSAVDLVEAWGPETRFIWTRRPLDESVRALQRQSWWPDSDRIQRTLFAAAERFFADKSVQDRCLIIDYHSLLADPVEVTRTLLRFLQLKDSDVQIEEASTSLRISTQNRLGPFPGSAERASHATAGTSIAATMISGNRELMVREAVMSVIDYVDRVILIDTGITDATARIVRELAGEKLRVLTRPWDNDFAGMRNAALREAESLGCRWALTIDTDERLLWGELTPKQLRSTLETDPLARAYMVMTQDGSYAKERLIRVPTSLVWHGRTHETIIGAAVNERPTLLGVSFWELSKTPEQMKIKLERDLVILREEVNDKPNVGRWWYYLGQTIATLGQHEGATTAFDRCASVRDWTELCAWACYMSAKSLAELKRFREAVDRCGVGLAIDPKSPELPWMAGWCEYQQGHWDDAIAWSLMSLAIGHAEGAALGKDRIGFRNLLGWHEGPLDVLRYALRKAGRDAEAADYEIRYESVMGRRVSYSK